MKKKITAIITVAACVLTAYAFWSMEPAHEGDEDHHDHEHHHDHDHENEIVVISSEQLKNRGVEIRTAEAGILQQSIKTPAKIVICADRIAHIYPKVAGTVVEAHKNFGQFVTIDETLATISSREMAEAKAEYLANHSRKQLAEGNFQREKNLYEKKISASQDFHQSENAREEALIELELSKQKLYALGMSEQEIAQLKYDPSDLLRIYEMKSPIAGKIVDRHITIGELISVDHEAFVVADMDKLWVEISVFPQDRLHVKEGQSVAISSHGGNNTHASIIYISPIIDEDTRTSLAIAEIDNKNGEWFPGTYVDAELITAEINSPVVISKESIQNIEGVDSIFVPHEEGFFVRPVIIGRSDAHQCEVIDGLSAGETYACKNTFLLKAHLQKDEAEHEH